MAEPFSTVAAAIALAGTVVQMSKTTKEFIWGIQQAPRSVSALSGNIDSLTQILETLSLFLQNLDHCRYPEQARLVNILNYPLNNCKVALEDIEKELKPFVRPLHKARLTKWKSFQFTFREKNMLALQRMLRSSQHSLDSAVAVVNFASSTNEFRAMKRMVIGDSRNNNSLIADSSFMGSDVVASDCGYTLKKYLLEAEIVYDSDSTVDFQVQNQQKHPGTAEIAEVEEGSPSPESCPQKDSQPNPPQFDPETAASPLYFGPSSDVWHRLELWHLSETDPAEASRRISILMRLLMLVSERMKARALTVAGSDIVSGTARKFLEEENELVEMLEKKLQLRNVRQTVEGRFHGNPTTNHLAETQEDENGGDSTKLLQ